MEERLNVAKTAYLNLVNLMQKQNIKESNEMLARVEQDLQNFTK
jgi:hypothetical protein